MSARNRILCFGGSALALLAGGILELATSGTAAEAVSLSLMSLGGIALVSFAFLEVGLSEDRERERERRASRTVTPRPLPRRRRRPD